jgi:hypothetical protein
MPETSVVGTTASANGSAALLNADVVIVVYGDIVGSEDCRAVVIAELSNGYERVGGQLGEDVGCAG